MQPIFSATERLLEAVGEQVLRLDLPSSLLAILELETKGAALTGLQIAKAAIATYHSDALKKYKWALDHLGPWRAEKVGRVGAGCRFRPLARTLRRMGRNRRRDRRVDGTERRGMISMPTTGSGKTRVAVQAIVEAMCHDSFKGGVLWVAGRDDSDAQRQTQEPA